MLTSDIKYDPTVNPSTSQEFSTGAFRVLHNIVPTQYRCEVNFFNIYIYIFITNFSSELWLAVGYEVNRVLTECVRFRFIDSNYNTVHIVNVTDWMNRPYLLQEDSNFDYLLRGLLYTEGRLSQPSYNQFVPKIYIYKHIITYNNIEI